MRFVKRSPGKNAGSAGIIGDLVAITLGILFVVFDSASFEAEGNVFAGGGWTDVYKFTDIYKYILTAAALLLFLMVANEKNKRAIYSRQFWWIAIATAIIVATNAIVHLSSDRGLGLAGVFVTESRNLALIPFVVWTFTNYKTSRMLKVLCKTICIVFIFRFIGNFVVYLTGGGVSIYGQSSLLFDGGIVTIGLGMSFLLLDKSADYNRARKKVMAWACRLFAVMPALLAIGSFRRGMIIMTSFVFFSAFLLDAFFRRSSARLIALLVAGAFAAIFAWIAALGFFGKEAVAERFASISFDTDSSMAASNNFYKDDWYVFGETLLDKRGIPIGFRQPYGTGYRLTDVVVEGQQVVLHVGISEMIVRMGLPGLFYVIVLLIIPLTLVFSAWLSKMQPVSFTQLGCFVLLLFTVFYPFTPPFYPDVKNCIIVAACLGVLLTRQSPGIFKTKPLRGARRRHIVPGVSDALRNQSGAKLQRCF